MNDDFVLSILRNMHHQFVDNHYHGWDLYDALLSKYFAHNSVINTPMMRYIWTQVNKRAPFNLRPLMKVPKSLNAKGLSLILRGYCELYNLTEKMEYLNSAHEVLRLLIEIRSDSDFYCWGNNFDYQSRGGFHPANSPNGITTSFVGNSIFDMYRITKDSQLLEILKSVKSYYLENMLVSHKDEMAIFKYYIDPNPVTYNATAKATETLALINTIIPDSNCTEVIKHSYNFILSKQNPDGSWFYADDDTGKWVDNFHTGYVLVALLTIKRLLNLSYGGENIRRGIEFHKNEQYTPDWIPRYYLTSLYPIDSHCFAQSIITFVAFNQPVTAKLIVDASIKNMYDPNGKYFIYSIRKHYKVRTNLLRWCNAFMFYGLSLYLATVGGKGVNADIYNFQKLEDE